MTDENMNIEQSRVAADCPNERLVMHGHNCQKVEHIFKIGYMHSEDDDTPYDVDGVTYCGRCHTFLDLQSA